MISGSGAEDATANITSVATDVMTFQTLQSLTLSGAAGENATLDFGTSGDVVLTIGATPVQLIDGSTLTIANWDGIAGQSNVASNRLIVLGEDPQAFRDEFSQSEIIFADYSTGYELVDLGDSYEVVAAIPEPGSVALLGLGGLGLLLRQRRRA